MGPKLCVRVTQPVRLPYHRASIFAAKIKSFSERPPIEWVESETPTLPHETARSGWCPSAYATAPILFAKASASAKFLNRYSFAIPFPCRVKVQPGSSSRKSSASARLSGVVPSSHGTHFFETRLVIEKERGQLSGKGSRGKVRRLLEEDAETAIRPSFPEVCSFQDSKRREKRR